MFKRAVGSVTIISSPLSIPTSMNRLFLVTSKVVIGAPTEKRLVSSRVAASANTRSPAEVPYTRKSRQCMSLIIKGLIQVSHGTYVSISPFIVYE